MAQTELAA